MNKNKILVFLVQCNAILFLLGYFFMHSFLSVAVGESTRTASILYNGLQLALSIYIIVKCHRDFLVEKGKSLLLILSITMVLYALHMVFDITQGPFVGRVPRSILNTDFITIVGGLFFPTWAMICSRKYFDIQFVSKGVFWFGLITCSFVILDIRMNGISFQEGRMEVGQGLHTLALARLGAITLMASFHVLVCVKKYRIWSIIGLLLGGFVALASGSRGGVAGVVVAMGVYFVMSLRKRPFLMLISVLFVIFIAVNIVSVLEWVGDFFPIISGRMLDTVIEGDQGGREGLRKSAIKLIIDNPIIGYGYRLNADETGYGPHNGILDIFLCLGIPMGLLFLYYVYIKGAFFAILMMKDKQFAFPCLMTVFSIVSSMSGSSLSSNYFNFSMVLVGISYYYHYKRMISKQPMNSSMGIIQNNT